MTQRSLACIAAMLMILCAGRALGQPKPLTLKLTYTTIHGGLKIPVPPATRSMPKLGLALSGGGARAAGSVGVLKILAKEGIPVSFIAGTSMGAGVGGLFAAGYSADEIEQILLENDWNSLFIDTPPREFLTQAQKEAESRHLLEFTFRHGRFTTPSGLTAGQKLTNVLAVKTIASSFEADFDFNKLKVPYRAIATDIETGDAVVIDQGLIHDAIRASSAIPLVFQPVEIQGRLLVDGGIVNNLPVDVVRSMGADVVIAVDTSTRLEKRERLTSLFEVMDQALSLQIRRESEQQATRADLLISPDTAEYSFSDFPAMREIIRKGEDAARAALPRLREILRTKTAAPRGEQRFRITSLAVRGNKDVPEATLRFAMMPVLFPREATIDDLLAALGEIYLLGSFSDVTLDLEKEGAGRRAVLTVVENPVVRSIEVSGNTIIPAAEFLATLSWQEGTLMNTTRLSVDLDAIVKKCRDQGYLLARVERAGMKPDGSTLEIVMYEGRIDSITVAGQMRTDPSLILREIVTSAGHPLNFNSAATDVQRLYALNYFESLNVDMTKSRRGGVDITIKVREKPTNKVRLGFRYDLGDRFTGLTDFVVDNVTGRGDKAYLNMRYGNYADITIGYHSPVVIATNLVYFAEAFYRERRYFLYEDQRRINELIVARTGADFGLGYQWYRFGDTRLRYRYTSDSIEEVTGVDPPRNVVRIGSLAFLATMDTRDEYVFPRSGVLFRGAYEMARPEFGSDNEFTKASAYVQGSVPLAERHTLVLEGSAGLGTGTLPYHELFGIGGGSYLLGIPLMGYQRREFVGSQELGFAAAYRWKFREYQLKALKALYVNVAGQAANVWERKRDISPTDLRNGASIGLHADTLIGPVKFDFGVGEQRRYTVYFAAGFDF